jgi:hypothetical protein
MKKYKVVQPVYLDFLTSQDQVTYRFTEGIVEWDEKNTIRYKNLSGEFDQETINGRDLLEMYIKDSRLIELK